MNVLVLGARVVLLSTLLIGVFGCASTPRANVAALQVTLSALETSATAYINLPVCGTVDATMLCSNPKAFTHIAQADNTAYLAVKTARQIEDDVAASSDSVDLAISTAMVSLNAFQTVLNTYTVKP